MSRSVAILVVMFCLLVGVTSFVPHIDASPAAEPPLMEIVSPSGTAARTAVILANIQKLDIITRGIAYDPARDRIYATTGQTGLPKDNAVVPITPDGVFEEKIVVDGIPQQVIASGDGQFLYVSLLRPGDGRPYMQRVNLADKTTEPKWELVPGEPDVCGYIVAGDMFTLPGNPHALAVVRWNNGCSPRQEGVAIYDDGIMRPKTDGDHSGPLNIEPSSSPDVLYGSDSGTWPSGVYFMTADATGVTITGSVTVEQAPGTDFTFVDGLLYFDSGLVFDPDAVKTVGHYEIGEVLPSPLSAVGVDKTSRRVYFIIPSEQPEGDATLMAFDQDSFKFLAAVTVPGLKDGVGQFINIAPNRFALRTFGEELMLMDVHELGNTLFMPVAADDFCAPFFDDFSDPTSGWAVGSSDLVESGYADGEYRIASRASGYLFLRGAPACAREHYEVSVDARWEGETGALYGITFGIWNQYDYFYLFAVNSDSQEFVLYRFEPTQVVTLAGLDYRYFIAPGNGVNHLRVIRQGSIIHMFVNGQEIGQIYDTTIFGMTQVGLAIMPYTNAPDADARFDNFSFTWLPPLDSDEANTGQRESAAGAGFVLEGKRGALPWER